MTSGTHVGRNINETDKGPNKYGLPKGLMNLTSNKSSENSRKVTWFMYDGNIHEN